MQWTPSTGAGRPTRDYAAQAVDACATNAITVAAFVQPGGVTPDPQATYEALHGQVRQLQRGVKSSVEAMLAGQAAALNAIFTDMAIRARANVDRPGNAAERYLRMALKAQNQCRATLDTLAGLRGTPSLYYAANAAKAAEEQPLNLAHGLMQARDGADGPHEGENAKNGQNELEDLGDDEGLDGRTAYRLRGHGARAPTLAAFDRAPND